MSRTKVVSISVSLVMVAAVLVAMGWLAGVFRRDRIAPEVLHAAATRPAGTEVVIQSAPRSVFADVAGTVQAEVKSSIASRLVANIVELKVNAGDRVKQGDILVVLDDAAPRARVEQARESLRAAEATRALAEVEWRRVSEAAQAKAASESERDTWKARLDSAAADVSKAQQSVKEAEVGLQDATLRSPISGIVIDRLAEPGEQASPGKPLLTVYDPSRLRVEAYVREAYISQLRTGQAVSVFVDALATTRKATVQQIVPSADPGSRSFLVKAALDDASDLYPGMFARVQLPLPQEQSIAVPRDALERIGQLAFVTVTNGEKVERRAVRTGREFSDSIEVLAGLQAGERVIVPTMGAR